MLQLGVILAAAGALASGCTEPMRLAHDVAVVNISPKSARIWIVGDSATFTVQITTVTGIAGTGIPVAWRSSNPSLLTVTAAGIARSLKKGGSAYIVATAEGVSDSAFVDVPLTPCGSVAPTTLALGQVVTDIGAAGFCATDIAGAEYAILAFNPSLVASSASSIEMIGQGLGLPPNGAIRGLSSRAQFGRSTGLGAGSHVRADVHAEAEFREAEKTMLSPRVADAKSWYRSRQSALRAVVSPAVGDIRTVNVSATNSCLKSSRVDHSARVAAVSSTAIILDDQANPTGGFTDAEYSSFATTFDTLVNPLDTQTFGVPTDLDNNGRVIIVFTRAINELTPVGSLTYTGGRTMSRDLFPRVSDGVRSGCDASNVGEIFYMLVPDPNGIVNGNTSFDKAFVTNQTMVTIAHEYQHLINISRRMYLLKLTSDKWFDEIWLQEGLSHMAEELLFHRSSGLPTRSDIGLDDLLATPGARDAFNNDMVGDFFLYDSYAAATAISGPYRQNDDLTTRGATWSFLRYAADRIGPSDGNLWFNLVNSGLLGLTNLETQLNLTATAFQAMVRDFTISVYADNNVGVDPKYTQPSWDMRSIYPGFGQLAFTFPLEPRSLADNAPLASALVAGGFTVFRFDGLPGTQALVRATGPSGTAMPAGITLSVVRTK